MIFKKQPTTWYPRIHNQVLEYTHGLETAVANKSCTTPILFYDEAIAASTIKTHPENASFAEVDSMNCMPDSRIDFINVTVEFSLTKGALETDKLHMVKCGIMKLHTSFEDLDALDELSGLTIGNVLELLSESTDRQTHPLYNNIKMSEKFTGSATLDALQPGMDATQIQEAVAFDTTAYYDAIHYFTIADKLKNCASGIKWFTLTKNRPFKQFKIKIHPKSKRINPFTFAGVMTIVRAASTLNQYHLVADTTNIPHVDVTIKIRYNEWNENFVFSKV